MRTTAFIAASAAVLSHTARPTVCMPSHRHESDESIAAEGEYYMELPEGASYVAAEAPVYDHDIPYVSERPLAAGDRVRGMKTTTLGLLALLSALVVGAALKKTKAVDKGAEKEQKKDGLDATSAVATASGALMVSGLIELLSSFARKATANPKAQALRGLPQLLLAVAVLSVAALVRIRKEDEEPKDQVQPPAAYRLTQDHVFSGVLAALGMLLVFMTLAKKRASFPVQLVDISPPEISEAPEGELIDAEDTAVKEQASMEPETEGETEDVATRENRAEVYPSATAPRADIASREESLSSGPNSTLEEMYPLGKEEFQLYMNQLAGLLGSSSLESLSTLGEQEASGEGEPESVEASPGPT